MVVGRSGKKAAVPIYKVLVRPGRGRTLDLPAPKRTHLPLDHELVKFISLFVVVRVDVICCQLIYFSFVIERTCWTRLVRLIALLVSVAGPCLAITLSVD